MVPINELIYICRNNIVVVVVGSKVYLKIDFKIVALLKPYTEVF